MDEYLSQQGIYFLLQLLQNLSRRHTIGHQLLNRLLQFGFLRFFSFSCFHFRFLCFQLGKFGIQLLQLGLLSLQLGLDTFQILFQRSDISCETLFGGCLLSDESIEIGGRDSM